METTTTTSDRRRWIALVVVCMAMLMNVLDSSVVNVALPAIQRDLSFSQSNLTWVVDAYLVTFGSFLLMAGRFGDLVGRKRVFLVGVAIFTLASGVCAIADTQAMLISARFVQGFGGAVSASVIVALIVTEFPRPADRAKAMSAYILVGIGGGSLGQLLGGVLTQAISWHWIFAINLPIGVATVVMGSVLLERDRGAGLGAGVDVLGSLLVTLALMVGIYAIVKVPEEGWGSGSTVGFGALSAGLMIVFLVLESRISNPIMPLRIFRVPGLAWSSAMRGCVASTMFAVLFLTSLYLVHVRGFTLIETGLASMPMAIVAAAMSSGITSRMIARFGARSLVPVGMTTVVVALLLFAGCDEHTAYFPTMFVAFAIFGLGMNMTFLPLLTIAMEHVPTADAGLGSGIANVSMQAAAAVGLALFSTIAANHTRSLRAEGQGLDQALTSGYQLAYLIAAGVVTAGVIFVVTILWRGHRAERDDAEAGGSVAV